MKDILINILESFGYPVFLQGSLGANEPYPESFFTFWNNDTYDWHHYNNNAIGDVWNFDVNFYSTEPALVNTALVDAKALLKSNGFIISGAGHDVASDEPTHTGRGLTALYIEKITHKEETDNGNNPQP